MELFLDEYVLKHNRGLPIEIISDRDIIKFLPLSTSNNVQKEWEYQ